MTATAPEGAIRVLDRRGMITASCAHVMKPHELLALLVELEWVPEDAVIGNMTSSTTEEGRWLVRLSWLAKTLRPVV